MTDYQLAQTQSSALKPVGTVPPNVSVFTAADARPARATSNRADRAIGRTTDMALPGRYARQSRLRHVLTPWSRFLPALCALTLALLPSSVHAGGAEDFATYCGACHGAEGRGGGPASAGLDVTPIDLARTTMTTEELRSIIKEGGAEVGRSPQMTAWGPVLDRAKIDALVRFIEGLRTAAPPDPGQTAEEQRAADALVKRLVARGKTVRAHRVLGVISATSMFAAQGFGLGNHIALGQGVRRDALGPTQNVHRALALTGVSTYFVSGLLAWTMPGPDGTPASKRLSPQMSRGRRAHIALSVAHGLAMVATVSLGMVSSYATKDTPAWTGTIVAHHAAAATTTTLLMLGVGLRTAF